MRRLKPMIAYVTLGIIAAGVVIVALQLLLSADSPITAVFAKPLVDQKTLGALSKKSASSAVTTRIASGIIPPTNSWLSGMVLQQTPLAVYPMPLSFLAKDSGFEVGLPTVQSTSTVIGGEHVPGIVASINNVTSFKLTRYDKVSASLTYYDRSNQQVGLLTLAEGSPYVFYHATSDSTLTLSNIESVISDSSSSYLHFSSGGHDYAVVAGKGAALKRSGGSVSISVAKDSLVTFYGLPDGNADQLRTLAGNELDSVTVSNNQQKTTSTTTFDYKTTNNQPTVFVPMNYSNLTNKGSSVGVYDSIYGPMTGTIGSSFTTSVPLALPSNALDLSHLTVADKQQLIATLQKDVASTAITQTDSYYAGKQLVRAATLLDISEQLGQTDMSSKLKSILTQAFSTRLDPSYWYYDTTLKGVAAQNKSFGTEDFNDHHFHYGYLIYAASILGQYDGSFVSTYANQVNLLVADIASYQQTKDYPLQRYFDPYAAHSWAAGLAPFSDGNNQESSSEAINAWNGVGKWAQLTKNDQLQSTATWMLSGEAATAAAAWRTVDINASYLQNYTSPLTSLNFGGKRTYSTFFSDDPAAKLGIQLLPMSPMMLTFASDGATINKDIRASITNDNYNVPLGDYILMYSALSSPQKAAGLLGKQQDSFIDDGNSRTYMDAWVFSLIDK